MTTHIPSDMETNQRINPSYGQKVSDPNAVVQERAGPITTDSLAAESVRSGGSFAGNRDVEPEGVEGTKSTYTTTDTSAAMELESAPNATSRGVPASEQQGAYPEGVDGQSKDHAVEYSSHQHYTTHNTSPNNTRSSAPRSSAQGGVAPSYVHDQSIRDTSGPHGKNIHEGGFSSNDSKNASWNTDIGSENDPGRLAEKKFQLYDTQSAQDAGFPRDRGMKTQNDVARLESEVEAP